MSVDRLQTVLQMSAEGADKVIAEINRVAQAMRGTTGPTSFESLPANLGQSIAEQRPETFNRIRRHQANVEVANRNYEDALARRNATAKRHFELALNAEATDKQRAQAKSAFRNAETAAIAASKRLDVARDAYAQEIYKSLPAVRERAREEALGAQMARDFVGQKRQELAQEKRNANERDRAERAEIRERQRATQQLAGQRNRAQAKQADLEHTRGQNALSREELSQLLATPDRQRGDSDRVYSARKLLSDAQINSAVQTERLADVAARAEIGDLGERTKALAAVNTAREAQSAAARRVVAAEERLERAINVQAIAMATNQRTSFRENFVTGFRGRGDNAPAYGEQLGQAFKFSVFYGTAYKLLFGLTQTLQATFNEAVQWQDAMTNLKLATGESEESLHDISQQLANQATRAGFAPSQGLEIGARSLGLYGVIDEDRATRERTMLQSARVVNQLAVGAEKAPVELQGDIAAITQALGLGSAGQFRVADLDAYMTKKFGVKQGSTLEVVAQSASVGKAAGFTDEELFGIAAQMISRTGQSGPAVAGYMAQIFSRGGEGSLVDVARRRGIDPDQNLSGILAALAQQYKTASEPDQAEISAAFGRGKVQNAAVGLIQDYDEVLSRSAQATADASGQADAQFKLKMDNIGGQVDLLMGVMREFASQLGESGLLDILGAGIITFREFLEVVNGLLKVWNLLPNVIQDTILALGGLALAVRSGAAGNVVAALATRGGTSVTRFIGPAARGAAYGPGSRVVTGADGTITAARSAAGARAIGAAGAAALGLTNPITYAIGGLLAIGALKNAADQMNDAMRQGRSALRVDLPSNVSPSEYRANASGLRTLARDNRDATPGWLNALTFGQANDDNMGLASSLRREARRLEAVAAREEAAESRSAAPEQLAFASSGAEDIAVGLQALEAGGYTAQERLTALRDVLFGTADAAEAAAAAFDPKGFAGKNASGVLGSISDAFGGAEFTKETSTWNADIGETSFMRTFGQRAVRNRLRAQLEPKDIQERLRDALAQTGIESEADLDGGNADKVARQVGKGIAGIVLAPYTDDPKQIREYQKKINAAIATYLLGETQDVRDLVSGNTPLSAEDAFAQAQFINEGSSQAIGTLAESDAGTRARILRQQIRDLRRTKANAADGGGQIDIFITQARRELARSQFDELERLRKSAQQNATSRAQIIRIGRSFLRRAIDLAISRGDTDLLVEIIGNAGRGSIAIARAAINQAIKVADAAIDEAQVVLQAAGYFGAQAATYVQDKIAQLEELGLPVPAELRQQKRALTAGTKATTRREELKGMRRDSRSAQYDPENTSVKGLDSDNPKLDDWYGQSAEEEKDRDSAAEIAAARAAAYATRSQSQIASARASILSARASLADAKKNTVEYWSAMGELFSAQQALTDAVRAYRLNKLRLSGDITNPLFEARVATREAAMRLRQDRASGAGPDVLAQDRVDLRSARANEESTRFSQRLQAVQTAEELGRISHKKYLSYLENEKRRLEGIKNRTFQQQDQLDQIDRLMKDAASQMEGQFNLGDIKLPTPYQVRRYVEQTSPSRSERMAATYSSTSYQTNYINGADVAMVKRTLRQEVSKGGRVRTAAPRKR